MKNQNIMCVSMTTWEGDYMKAVVHMMGHLAKNNQVLFVDYAFTFKDLIKGLLGKSNIPVKPMLGIAFRLQTIEYQGNKLHHLTLPPVLPINWINSAKVFDFIMNLQVWLISFFTIRPVLKKLKFDNLVMINAFNPLMGVAFQKSLKAAHTIYYCYDEIGAAGWCSKHGKRLEAQLATDADLTIVTSTALLESKSKFNPNTQLIKNGVDFQLFHSAFQPKQNHPRPQIGYVGSIDFRVDFDLLEKLVQAQMDYDFIFIGRITDKKGADKLAQFANVKMLGAQQPDLLPSFLSEMDVTIIPFVKNEFTRNIYPLKINEYLAAGLPVVSTDFADLSDFNGLIHIENDAEGFSASIEKSLKIDESLQTRQIEMARTNDWSDRAKHLEEAISQLEFTYEKTA